MKMNNDELRKVCEVYCQKIWGHFLSVDVKIDGRIKNSLGFFRHYDEKRNPYANRDDLAIEIKFSRNLFENYDEKIIKSVILHELTHYYLFVSGSTEYADGEKEFEDELSRIGSHSTGKIAYCGKIYLVYCPKCYEVVKVCKTKAQAEKICRNYRSACHNFLLDYVEQERNEETEEISTNVVTPSISEILGR